MAWQRLCRTHARIRRQAQRWHIRQTRQTRTLPSAGIHAVGFPPNMVCQYHDAEIGVQLASTADPDKAFAPCTAGVVLGVHACTTTLFPLFLLSLRVMIDIEGPQI